MDKALEQITKLQNVLESLYFEKDSVEDKLDFKKDERKVLLNKNHSLCSKIKDLEYEENNIQYKLENIKRWKIFTIIKTTLIAISWILAIIFVNFKLGGSVLATLICSAFAIPFSIFFGESGCYYFNKKYLKKYKLEDIQKEIKEKSDELSLNNEKITTIEAELAELNSALESIKSKINLTEDEIKELRIFRSDVINKFINNNTEFESLVCKEYESGVQKKLKMR